MGASAYHSIRQALGARLAELEAQRGIALSTDSPPP